MNTNGRDAAKGVGMNIGEFKAWFEGFTETMKGPPNAEQWKRIRSRVKEISETEITREIFIDRYVRPYKVWWKANEPTLMDGGSTGEDTIPDRCRPKLWCSAGKAEFASLTSSM